MKIKGREKKANTSFSQPDSSFNYAISQIFNASLFSKIHNDRDELIIRTLINDCNLYPENQEWNLVNGLEIAYNYLKQNYRCEYIYKNEIANQLLLQFHSDNSATFLREVPSSSSIADVVIINGNTTVYEIKTELDSFERLPNQLESYKSLYDNIYIVTHPKAIKALIKLVPKYVGIIVFDSDGLLKLIRQATIQRENFSQEAAVLTIRQSELLAAYKKYVGDLPEMGTAILPDFCQKWYLTLDFNHSHKIFAESLKSRRPSKHQFELILKSPQSLKMLFLSKTFSKKYCHETLNKLCIFD